MNSQDQEKFKKLKKSAEAAFGRAVSAEDIANYFLSSGTEFKGQNQFCYKAMGYRIDAEASLDLLKKLSLGVFSSEVTIKGSGAILDKALITADVGPSIIQIENYPCNVDNPVMINFCFGKIYAASFSPSFFVGLQYKAEAKGPRESGVKVSAKLGAEVSAEMSGDIYDAVSVLPLDFKHRDHQKLVNVLTKMFAADTYKEFIKKPAVEFINDHGGQANYFRKNFWGVDTHIETDELVSKLKGLKNLSSADRGAANQLSNVLTAYKERRFPAVRSGIRVVNCHASGEISGVASAKGAIEIPYFSAELSTENKALHFTKSYKPVWTRAQTVYETSLPNKGSRDPKPGLIVMTQDTTIRYSSTSFDLLESENKLKTSSTLNLGEVSVSRPIKAGSDNSSASSPNDSVTNMLAEKAKAISEKVKQKVEQYKYRYNTMDYIASTIYWHTPPKLHPYFSKPSGNTNDFSHFTYSLVGSGISFGASFLFEELAECISYNYDDYEAMFPRDDPKDETSAIVKKLRQTLDDYERWFDDRGVAKAGLSTKPTAFMGLRKLLSTEENQKKLMDGLRWLMSVPTPDLSAGDKNLFKTTLKEPMRLGGKATDYISATKTEFRKRIIRCVPWSKEEATQLMKAVEDPVDKLFLEALVGSLARNEANEQVHQRGLVPSEQDRSDYMARKNEMVTALANRINLSHDEFRGFLDDCKDLIIDHDIYFEGVEAILIESGFKMDGVKIEAKSSLIKDKGIFSDSVIGENIEMPKSNSDEFIKKFDRNKHALNVVRMRYRIQDASSEETVIFKLGLKILGTGAKGSASEVEEAGSQGVVDLHTKWFGVPFENKSSENYDQGVPAVGLFSIEKKD